MATGMTVKKYGSTLTINNKKDADEALHLALNLRYE